MANILSSLNRLTKLGIIGGIVILAVVVGIYTLSSQNSNNYQFVTVEKGSIIETVSITGNTTPVSSVTLGFGNSGTISNVSSSVGENVEKGQVLASLNTDDLYSQIKQAQANVEIQQSKLLGLEAGSRPEDIAIAESNVASAKQNLESSYNKALVNLNTAYTYVYNAYNVVKILTNTYFYIPDQQPSF